MFQSKVCYGTNPTNIRNGSPSHDRHALHNLLQDQKYHHMHRLQYPLLPECEYFYPAFDRLLPRSRLLQELLSHFLRYTPAYPLRLPAFSVWQMLHNFHSNNKFLYYSSHFFLFLYYDILPSLHQLLVCSVPFYNSLQHMSLHLHWQRWLPYLNLSSFSFPYWYSAFLFYVSIISFLFLHSYLQNRRSDKKLIISPVLIKTIF